MRNSHRQPSTFHVFPCRTKYFKNSFFTNVISEHNKVDPNICSPSNYHIFCNALLKFIRPIYSAYSIQKQPTRRVPRKRCSDNIQQIYRRTPMPKAIRF